MSVSPSELKLNNGKYVKVVDFTESIYQGFLHYNPADQYQVQIWKNGDCCFISFLQVEDIASITPVSPRFTAHQVFQMPNHLAAFVPNLIPCFDLPEVMLMDITSVEIYECLVHNSYILEWNYVDKRYELTYPALCGCNALHVQLSCAPSNWFLYMGFLNPMGTACIDGFHLNFPIRADTLIGSAKIHLRQTEDCTCGPHQNDVIQVTIRAIR